MGNIRKRRTAIEEQIQPRKWRSFGGKTEGFENKMEQRQEQKHLKAYLKGYNRYKFGKNPVTGDEIWFDVIENWN